MSNPQQNPGYVDPKYLQALMNDLQPIKQKSYERMKLATGLKVLDVGCGPATDTIPMGHIVTASGEVIGVDYDPEMVAHADQKAVEAGVSGWVHHQVEDGSALSFDSNTFDAAHAERVFQHVDNSAPLMAEMVRVTKPGGWIVVVDTDHSSLSIDCVDRQYLDTDWKFQRFRADFFKNGYAGLQLYRLFKSNHLVEVSTEIFNQTITDYQMARYFGGMEKIEAAAVRAGVLTAQEVRAYRRVLEESDQHGTFFGFVSIVMVTGQKRPT